MSVEALKCPNCGASVKSKDVTKCEYCGVTLVFKNDTPTLKKNTCPECGAMVGEGSFFCNNCEELLATSSEDLNFLRSTLKKVKLLQDKNRKLIGQIDATHHMKILERLERDEFIYVFLPSETVSSEVGFWVVTNKRVLRHSNGKTFDDADIFYEDIAFVNEPEHVALSGETFYRVGISLFSGDEVSFSTRDYNTAHNFHNMCAMAYEDYESARDLKRKDTVLLLWKLKDKIKL